MNAKEFSRFANGLLKAMEAIPPSWMFLRNTNGHASKVTTWATRELAQDIASRYEADGKPARVVEYQGRFAVQIYC